MDREHIEHHMASEKHVEAWGLGLAYDGKHILDGIDFSIARGEIVAVIGPSGCGKTTFLSVLAGILVPSCGTVQINRAPDQLHATKCAYMFQDDRLLPWRNLLDNVLISDEIRRISPVRKRAALGFLSAVGLEGFEAYYPHELSGGMRKRAALARTLFQDGELVLLDEPEASIDYLLRLKLERLIFQYVTQNARSLIMVTHSHDTAAALADRIVLMTRSPSRIQMVFDAGLARQYGGPTKARHATDFFDLTTALLDNCLEADADARISP
ncbi:MAG: ATP-binding cassette domain-containing protein [Nitrospiraceae bacterium]|nr:ATP-binding cassette domain-containing protein [Nitrospiraceae bacterium]